MGGNLHEFAVEGVSRVLELEDGVPLEVRHLVQGGFRMLAKLSSPNVPQTELDRGSLNSRMGFHSKLAT